MKNAAQWLALGFFVVFGSPVIAQQEPSAEDISQSNNPLSDLTALNLDNYYAPSLYDVDGVSNSMNLQGAFIPIRRHLKLHHILRATLPIVTVPGSPTTYESGLGDFSFFDAFKLSSKGAETEYGIGPLFIMPTATSDALGAGKWQIGASFILVHLMEGGSVTGALVTWPTDFAGDPDRPGTNLATFQPNLALVLGRSGYYFSSSPIWTFDFENHRYLVPFSVGLGKVFAVGKTIVNVSAESQFTVYHKGEQQPALQIFAALTLQWKREPKPKQ